MGKVELSRLLSLLNVATFYHLTDINAHSRMMERWGTVVDVGA